MNEPPVIVLQEITYEVPRDLPRSGWRRYFFRRFGEPLVVFSIIGGASVASLVLMIPGAIHNRNQDHNGGLTMVTLLGVLSGICFMVGLLYLRLYFRGRRAILGSVAQRVTLRVLSDTFSMHTNDTVSTRKWSTVKRLWRYPDLLFFFRSKHDPPIAVPSAQLRAEVIQAIEEKVRAYGGEVTYAGGVSNPIPPPLPVPVGQKTRTLRSILKVLLVSCLTFVGAAVLLFAVCAGLGFGMWTWMTQGVKINFRSTTDQFRVTVLESKSLPNYFMERVRVRCQNGMKTGLWVTDVRQAGLFEATNANGETYYRIGNPHRAGLSGKVPAQGKYSMCEFLFRVTTTASNTVWYCKGVRETPGGTCSGSDSSTLPASLTVNGVRTNWPGTYNRGSEIPLANLGKKYKVLLSVQ